MKGWRVGRKAQAVCAAGAAAALCLLSVQAGAARAQEAITSQTLVDRAEITDLLTRYYYNFGGGSSESFTAFYTPDAELDLGPKSYKGAAGIAEAYKSAGQASPAAKRFSFNVLMTNPLIVVHGDRATARLIFTEVVMDTEGAPPRLLTQGHEFDNLVKTNGRWLIQRRQIMSAAAVPPGWVD